MESSTGQNKDHGDGDGLGRINQGSGGCRRGAGRKRLHEGGYRSLQNIIWKNITVHTDVFNEWVKMKDLSGFTNNSDFAGYLLNIVKKSRSDANTDENTLVDDNQIVESPMSNIRGFCPLITSTPVNQNVRAQLFPSNAEFIQSKSPETSRIQNPPLLRSGTEQVFIDTVIRNTSLCSMTMCDSDSDDESDDDYEVLGTSSDSSGSEYGDEDLADEIKQLQISFDQSFLDHNTENVDHNTENVDEHDSTNTQSIEMDMSSTLESRVIECNVPAMEEQTTMEGNDPKATRTPRLPKGYENTFGIDIETELSLAKENKFVCSTSKVLELFNFCQDRECRMPIVEVNEKCIGCTLEIRWKCKAGHYGDWQSSKIVNRVYVNNIQSAASLLFTGNNFTKLSLFSKCFGLAFISSSTFGRYQKKFLARSVHYWWNTMQEKMFDALGDQPVIVSGDGQMDSPGFSAKNCTYTLMHATSDYVLGVEVVDVRHSQLKSVVMEKVGCERALDTLMGKVNVVELVTDASSQIIKMIATNGKYKNISHQLDIWHKSIKLDKKLNEAGN